MRKRGMLTYVCAILLALGSVGVSCAAPRDVTHADSIPLNTIHVDKDVAYGTVGNASLLLDVFQPAASAAKRPAIVLIHGGGFIFGDKTFYGPMGRELAGKGYVVFSINYRLAPVFRYPAQLDDAQRAVRWIRAHAETYHVDPDRIGALGDSAGGYLVSMLGLRDTRNNEDPALASFSSRVQCVVDFYGPSDFTLPVDAPGVSPQAIELLKAFFGKTQAQAPDLYREGSPIRYVTKQAPPFLIVHGTADTLVPPDQSTRLCDALKAAGANVTLSLFYKYPHGFLTPSDPKAAGALADEFFLRLLKP